VPAGHVAADATASGVYRAGGEVPRYLHEAPRLVRWTALTCFLFGQMFVPGLAVALLGLFAGGVGFLGIPGLITAAKIYRVGLALLRRETRAAVFRARDAAAWALWLNGIIFVGSLAFVPHAFEHAALARSLAFIDGYGAASMLQALLMLRCARVWEDAFFML
jgi:hypothetical protein